MEPDEIVEPELVEEEEDEEKQDPEKFRPPEWLTEPYAILRVHVREYYRLQRARIRAKQQYDWLKRWFPTVQEERLNAILEYGKEQGRLEDAKKRIIAKELKGFPFWTEWASKIRGVGPILCANLLGEAGPPERFEKVSAYWRYWGAGVVDGRSEVAVSGEKRHFSRYLKTARWKMGKSFVMTGAAESYGGWYRQRKVKEMSQIDRLTEILRERRKLAPEAEIKGVKAYADMRARRWTVKLFLSHAWEVARVLAGKPAGYSYAFTVLGHSTEHHIPPPLWVRPENREGPK